MNQDSNINIVEALEISLDRNFIKICFNVRNQEVYLKVATGPKPCSAQSHSAGTTRGHEGRGPARSARATRGARRRRAGDG
jgi:hypothetical protein